MMCSRLRLLTLATITVVLAGCAGEPASDTASPEAPRANGPAKISTPDLELKLREAAAQGFDDQVVEALDRGADPNAADEDARTALMYAAFQGHIGVVSILVEHGVDLDLVDWAGRTALMYGASGPNPELVQVLLDAGAKIDIVDNGEHWSALMFAAGEGQAEVVETLLSHGADPNLVDVDGDTALTFANRNHHDATATLLEAVTSP